jgi:squalene-associated FAD-dependent desaturase
MKLAIVGGGWAGMAAAVAAADRGIDVSVFEAARVLGGRARSLAATRPDGVALTLDNGQHILIGAYSESLRLMRLVGLAPEQSLIALPLALPYPDGGGLQTPPWAASLPAPLDALAAIATARGWSWGERLALVRASLTWRRAGFVCAPTLTVGDLCAALPQRVMDELIEPLCVSALNLPAAQASAQVFLRVMRDALFDPKVGGWSASSLLLPRVDLSALFPQTAARWLQTAHPHSSQVHLGARVDALQPNQHGWRLQVRHSGEISEQDFDAVIWATGAAPAAQAMQQAGRNIQANPSDISERLMAWGIEAAALDFTAITTVYAWAAGARLTAPMLALRNTAQAPAQFVFDRGQLNPADAGAQGVLAFVISASEGERDALEAAVLRQAREQLDLATLQPIQTVVDKRATFACTPGLHRPTQTIAPGLWAAGDYVAGPYPATLEGAVRSGLAAVAQL